MYFGWAKVIFKDKSKSDAFGKQPRRVVVNVGARPSFDDGSDITIEVHIINYEDGMFVFIFNLCCTSISVPNQRLLLSFSRRFLRGRNARRSAGFHQTRDEVPGDTGSHRPDQEGYRNWLEAA